MTPCGHARQDNPFNGRRLPCAHPECSAGHYRAVLYTFVSPAPDELTADVATWHRDNTDVGGEGEWFWVLVAAPPGRYPPAQ